MTQKALRFALEALDNLMYWDNGKSEYDEARDAIIAIKQALAQHDSVQAKPEPEQEPVAWGVDWGKAGDIPCVSIIKRLPDGGIKVLAVEYAPYSYTSPPQQEPVGIMREMLEVQGQHGNWNYDSYMHGLYNGMEYMVALAEKREPKFRDAPDEWLAKYEVKRDNFNSTEPLTEATPPQRTWVGLTDEEVDECYYWKDRQWTTDELVRHVEAKLKQKNGFAEEKNT